MSCHTDTTSQQVAPPIALAQEDLVSTSPLRQYPFKQIARGRTPASIHLNSRFSDAAKSAVPFRMSTPFDQHRNSIANQKVAIKMK
jgi:hypothetical protein